MTAFKVGTSTVGGSDTLAGSDGGGGSFSQTVTGVLPAQSGTVAAVVARVQTILGNLPSPTGTVADVVARAQTVLGNLPAMSGVITGGLTVFQTILGSLPAMSGTIASVVTRTQTILGNLPAMSGTISRAVAFFRSISGALPAASGSITTSVARSQSLSGVLSFTGVITGAITILGDLFITLLTPAYAMVMSLITPSNSMSISASATSAMTIVLIDYATGEAVVATPIFAVGSDIKLPIETRVNDTLTNPSVSTPTISIFDPTGATVVDEEDMTNDGTGEYHFWYSDPTLTGVYSYVVTAIHSVDSGDREAKARGNFIVR